MYNCTLRGEIPTGISDTHSLVIFSIEFCDEFHGIWRNDLQRRGCPATAHVRLHRQVHLVEVDKPVRLLWTVPGWEGGGGGEGGGGIINRFGIGGPGTDKQMDGWGK